MEQERRRERERERRIVYGFVRESGGGINIQDIWVCVLIFSEFVN